MMRQRQQLVKNAGLGDGIHNTTGGRTDLMDSKLKQGTSSVMALIFKIAGLCILLVSLFLLNPLESDSNIMEDAASSAAAATATTATEWDWKKYAKCPEIPQTSITTTTTTMAKETDDYNKTTKTLWVASFPDSLNESLLKEWVQGVVAIDMRAPVKAYYLATRKSLRRCQSSNSITVLCTVVHPMIDMNPPPNAAKFTSYIGPTTIYTLRNPVSAFPAHHNAKAIKYHNLPPNQQVDEKEWRAFRDGYLEASMQGWKRQLRTWARELASSYYHVGLFLPFEHIRHPQRGPQLIQQLQQLLHNEGYPVLEEAKSSENTLSHSARRTNDAKDHDDLPTRIECLWYNSVIVASSDKPLPLRTTDEQQSSSSSQSGLTTTTTTDQQKNHFHDFAVQYMPRYKRSQIEMMIQEMTSFVQELQTTQSGTTTTAVEETLMTTLREYIQEIRNYPHLEED